MDIASLRNRTLVFHHKHTIQCGLHLVATNNIAETKVFSLINLHWFP